MHTLPNGYRMSKAAFAALAASRLLLWSSVVGVLIRVAGWPGGLVSAALFTFGGLPADIALFRGFVALGLAERPALECGCCGSDDLAPVPEGLGVCSCCSPPRPVFNCATCDRGGQHWAPPDRPGGVTGEEAVRVGWVQCWRCPFCVGDTSELRRTFKGGAGGGFTTSNPFSSAAVPVDPSPHPDKERGS